MTKMKQILPKLKEVNKHLNFAKMAFTKCGFRHFVQYVDGLITLNRKTARQISRASIEENDHSAIGRLLTVAVFEGEELEKRYLKKIKFLTTGQKITLLFDDTLVERNGEHIEEAQHHYDHSDENFIRGHQFFTSIIHTPVLQLPLFPRLYSKNTDSKIQMASDLIDKVLTCLHVDTVSFDSWYSDKKIINKCITKKVKVVCAIKRNRSISFTKGEWQELSTFSKTTESEKLENYYIDEIKYKTGEYKVKLSGIPTITMIISYEWNEDKKCWKEPFHLISTNARDTPVQIIRQYRIRWFIETYHRDIKQNLGFATAFMHKKEGIVRHAIFVAIAYAILKLFMFLRGITKTIGECCAYTQDQGMDEFIRQIVEIEDKETRIKYFEEVFIRETAKV